MKKSTQKRLMAISIVLIFALSSIAFVFTGFQQPQQQIKSLDSFVIDGEIDPQVQAAYVEGGFTFLKLYYNTETSADIIGFADAAPSYFTTPNGQVQLVSQKITSGTTYANIVNYQGDKYVANVTVDSLFSAICARLTVQSTECALRALSVS